MFIVKHNLVTNILDIYSSDATENIMQRQHWFIFWILEVRQLAVTGPNVEKHQLRHMLLLGRIELMAEIIWREEYV